PTCAKCCMALYCSKACQKSDWHERKHLCRKVSRNKTRKPTTQSDSEFNWIVGLTTTHSDAKFDCHCLTCLRRQSV
ncbi:hypothetical protein EON65_34930, partial [archaeon]